MASREDSWPLRLIPFSGFAHSFSDGFAYTAGNLDGQGPWLKSTASSPIVQSAGLVHSPAATLTTAYALGVLSGINWLAPWTASTTNYTGNPPTGQVIGIKGGGIDAPGNTWSLILNVTTGVATWVGSDGTTATHTFSSTTPASLATLSVASDGAGNVTVNFTGGGITNTPWTTASGSFASAASPSVGFTLTANAGATEPYVASIAILYN